MSTSTEVSPTGSLDKHDGMINDSTRPKPRRRRCLGHFKRFWWIYLLVLIAVVLIVVLPIIFVAYPRMAQDQVNQAQALITTLKITNPTPTSFHLVQEGFSSSSSSNHPYLEMFNASLALAGDAAYGTVTVPGLNSDSMVPVHIEQDVQITDVQAYADYNVKVLTSETFTQRVNGTTSLRMGSLPSTSVTYDKTVEMKGFNLFPGFNITCLSIDPTALLTPNSGPNIHGTVLVPNPSSIAVFLGNVTYNTYIDDTPIGNTTINNFYLQPGNNTYWFTGYTDTVAVLAQLLKYPKGVVPMEIRGNVSIADGQHLTYYEQALKHDVHTVQLDVGLAQAVKECVKPAGS